MHWDALTCCMGSFAALLRRMRLAEIQLSIHSAREATIYALGCVDLLYGVFRSIIAAHVLSRDPTVYPLGIGSWRIDEQG
jgi:hypothetical protein